VRTLASFYVWGAESEATVDEEGEFISREGAEAAEGNHSLKCHFAVLASWRDEGAVVF
jgi:hypothetical protein